MIGYILHDIRKETSFYAKSFVEGVDINYKGLVNKCGGLSVMLDRYIGHLPTTAPSSIKRMCTENKSMARCLLMSAFHRLTKFSLFKSSESEVVVFIAQVGRRRCVDAGSSCCVRRDTRASRGRSQPAAEGHGSDQTSALPETSESVSVETVLWYELRCGPYIPTLYLGMTVIRS